MENKIHIINLEDLDIDFDIIRMDAGTIESVNIPCILALPKNNQNSKLTMVFNNEGGESLEQSAENIEKEIPNILRNMKIQSPVVIPILPSQKEFNVSLRNEEINDLEAGEPKQFALECFDSRITPNCQFYRIDEQVTKLLQSVQSDEELQTEIQTIRGLSPDKKLVFDDKITGFGHSGAGAAMLRYGLMHPEVLETMIIGGNGDIIPTPFGTNGLQLGYPFGIKDYKDLFGHDFSEEDYKRIKFQFYIGDSEDRRPVLDTIRDSNYGTNGTGPKFAPEKLATQYKKIYGTDFFERFKNALEQYKLVGANIGLKIYENDCHSPITAEDLQGIMIGTQYFDNYCSNLIPEMLNKRKKIVMADGCPAETIRKYIEKLKARNDKNLPGKITLSQQSLNRIANGFVDKIWQKNEGEYIFIWNESEDFPALEVVIKTTDNGEYEVTYMKEDRTDTSPEFIWESNERANEILIAKDQSNIRNGIRLNESDALDEIIDMDDKKNIPEAERD